MDSMWNDDGIVMEWLIPYGIQHHSLWIPLDSIWNGAYPAWTPWNKKFHMENTMIFVVKNSVKYENWTLNSVIHHMREWENTLTAAPSDHWNTITWPQYILCTMATAQPMLNLGVNKHINKQQPSSSSTTTTTTTIHDTHPWHRPIITASPSLPTTDNHLDMPVHHPNDAETPHQQPAGQWEAMAMMWHINWCLMVTALCPAPGKHPQPVPTVPFLTMKQVHVIYMATRRWTMTLFIVIFSDNKWLMTTTTDHNHNHNRWQPCHNDGRMTPCDEMTTPRRDDNMTTTTHHPRTARTAMSTQHHPLAINTEGPAPLPTNSNKHPTPHPTNGDEHPPPTNDGAHNDDHMMSWWWQCDMTMTLCSLL